MPDQAHEPKTICRRFDKLELERGVWEQEWQSIADLVMPTTEFVRTRTPGEARRYKMYDPTAPEAATMLASTLHTLITNPQTQWLHLAPSDNRGIDDEGAAWLQDRSMDLLAYYNSPNSGANTMFMEVYQNLVAFGTAPFIRKPMGAGKLAKYFAVPLSSLYLETDESGEVVGCYRLIEYDPRDLAEDFGAEKLSDASQKLLRDAVEGNAGDKKVAVIHAVFKNSREYDSRSPFKKPWASVYIERDEKHAVRQGGFDRNPYHVPRWARHPGESYGRSPAMKMLPAIKLINCIARDTIIAAEMGVRPPIMVPANGSMQTPWRTAPGSVNYYQMGSRDRPEVMQTGADASRGMMAIEFYANHIRQGFFNDLLRLPEQDRMTALEVSVRSNQKLQVMSPVLSRMIAEMLGPMVFSDFNMMLGGGMFPQAPRSLQGRTLKVEYKSPMAVAQQTSQANNLLQLMGVVAPLIQADPELMREIDGARTLRDLALTMNATSLRFRDSQQVEAERRQERQAALQQQGATTAAQLAGAGKDAADAVNTIAGSEGLRIAQ